MGREGAAHVCSAGGGVASGLRRMSCPELDGAGTQATVPLKTSGWPSREATETCEESADEFAAGADDVISLRGSERSALAGWPGWPGWDDGSVALSMLLAARLSAQ